MSASAFAATVRHQPPIAIMDLTGDLTDQGEAVLSDGYAEAVGQRPEIIVLNFASVGYINSAGIALIVTILDRTRADGMRLCAAGLSAHYREIFEITRLVDYIQIVDDEDDLQETVRA